eukprot:m.97925 g.97925  ORF g.97925 m.97925 type:complete len:217 (+) comp36967_c1_seq6:134-784(+)
MMGQENVFLFAPNLLGYLRVILAFAAFSVMMNRPALASFLYLLSGFLDSLDGQLARSFGQSSKFGATLDMLTDRCGTLGLIMVLAIFYQEYALLFQFLCILDIASHWLQMYSTLLKGESSHKTTDVTSNPILRLYYTSRSVLFVMCSGNELFFAMLYLLHFSEGPEVPLGSLALGLWRLIAYITFPICFVKQVISIVQMVGAARQIAEIDIQERQR